MLLTRAIGCVAVVVLAGGCATVIEDDPGATADDEAATTTTSTLPDDVDDGLALIQAELSELSWKIADGEGDDESLGLIVATWDAVRSDVEEAAPGLVRGFDATIEMAEVAVERTRPADADKAAANFEDFVATYRARS